MRNTEEEAEGEKGKGDEKKGEEKKIFSNRSCV